MKNINLILATFFIVVCFASIICGRFATFHNTEMEAFFYGWQYWTVAIIAGIIALWFRNRSYLN